MILYGLTVENLYNIFIFIIWIGSIALFFFSICLRLWIKSTCHIKNKEVKI